MGLQLRGLGFPSGSDGKASACNAGDLGLIPGSGRSPGEGNGNSSTLAWKIPWVEEPIMLPVDTSLSEVELGRELNWLPKKASPEPESFWGEALKEAACESYHFTLRASTAGGTWSLVPRDTALIPILESSLAGLCSQLIHLCFGSQ